MAMLLKKVWESVSNRASSCSTSSIDSVTTPLSHTESSSSLGAFDRLPIDVVLQIVKLVGPKDAARLRVVCKSWRSSVSDNRLWIYFLQNYHDTWDSVFFAETHLRSGFPIQWVSRFSFRFFFKYITFFLELFDFVGGIDFHIFFFCKIRFLIL